MKMTLEALNAIEKLTGNSLNLEWGVNALIATEKKKLCCSSKERKRKRNFEYDGAGWGNSRTGR